MNAMNISKLIDSLRIGEGSHILFIAATLEHGGRDIDAAIKAVYTATAEGLTNAAMQHGEIKEVPATAREQKASVAGISRLMNVRTVIARIAKHGGREALSGVYSKRPTWVQLVAISKGEEGDRKHPVKWKEHAAALAAAVLEADTIEAARRAARRFETLLAA